MDTEFLIFIVFFGLLFDYTNGFHDAADVVATSIATKALRPTTAIILASIFNFCGATQVSAVAKTMMISIVNPNLISKFMLLASIMGAVSWNFLTWWFGIPSSSSYALIGGLIGTAFFQWGKVGVMWKSVLFKVIIPMTIAPPLGLFIAFFVMHFFFKFIDSNKKIFRYLQIGSASLIALSHGTNDAQKSMGVITLGLFTAGAIDHLEIPIWVIIVCAVVMASGTLSGGRRIIQTLGFNITKLKPVQGFVAEMSASGIILLAGVLGIPLSSTHVITGNIIGVGIIRGEKAIQWHVCYKIMVAWGITIPGSALISAMILWFFL